jgi:hypothetical protein
LFLLLFCSFIVVLNFCLYFEQRGLVLTLYPQQGHHMPSHLKNIEHT